MQIETETSSQSPTPTVLQSQNVDCIKLGEQTIYLVGTAHVSKESVELADAVIRQVKPDAVAIELCQARYQSLQDPNRWKNTDIFSIIRSGRVHLLAAQLLIASFQKKLAKNLEITPGAEMMRAASVANELNAPIILADRDVRTTLKRTWAGLSLLTGAKLVAAMIESVIDRAEVKAEEIERLKNADALTAAINEFSRVFPEIRISLIDERDQFLAAKIQEAPYKTIVAVIGAGHVPGMKEYFGKKIDLEKLNQIPEPSLLKKIASWILPGAVIVMLLYGFWVAGAGVLEQLLSSWVWITGLSAALGALLALAHPLTILAAFLSAPITTLHPLIGSGMVAGLVEAWVRKPRVSDLETIADDMGSFKTILKNRVCRIILVVISTSIFGSIGMLVGVSIVAKLVSKV